MHDLNVHRRRLGARLLKAARLGTLSLLLAPAAGGDDLGTVPAPSALARELAAEAVARHGDATVAALGELVAFQTVHQEGVANADHEPFGAMTAYLRQKAEALGLDFADHGATVVIGLGEGEQRLGIVTHGDVQPAAAGKWARDPFTLDSESEPGKLLARGSEDDKGPIAIALYAMKTLADRGLPLARRIELIVSYTEESDWTPFVQFLAGWTPPQLNVAIDAEYPVVVAEKGWGSVLLTLAPVPAAGGTAAPWLRAIEGGAFLSQIPEDARAVIAAPTPALGDRLRAAADELPQIRFRFLSGDDELVIKAQGLAAHSSKPWEGRNAISHLAALLGTVSWPDSQAARMVRLINDLVGTGDQAERFGAVAYEHPFMGPLTLSLTTLKTTETGLQAGINLRRPAGRERAAVEDSVRRAIEAWQRTREIDVAVELVVSDPIYVLDAPHVPVLLGIYRAFTGQRDAQPISIGGSTHAKLLPNTVNFGPAMPGEVYTGHTEHEFMTREQLRLNLQMYTAMLVELAAR